MGPWQRQRPRRRASQQRSVLQGSSKRAHELKAATLWEDGAKGLAVAVTKLDGLLRQLVERFVELVQAAAPQPTPKICYGFPTWAQDGKVMLFFKPASKFNTRCAKIEFDDAAAMDAGTISACFYGLIEVTAASAKAMTALVKKSFG